MTTRPTALRLADEIDPLIRYSLDNLTCSAAATELRRLHNEILVYHDDRLKLSNEVDQLRAALGLIASLERKPADEPVAYPEGDVVGPCICGSWPGGKCLKCPRITPPAAPVQEPVSDAEIEVWAERHDIQGTPTDLRCMFEDAASFNTPPAAQRQWVGLTEDDIRPLCKQTWVFDTVKQWAEIIEAKLKEKNT